MVSIAAAQQHAGSMHSTESHSCYIEDNSLAHYCKSAFVCRHRLIRQNSLECTKVRLCGIY